MKHSGVSRRCAMRVATRVAVGAVVVLACVSGAGLASAGGSADTTLTQDRPAGPSVGDYLAPDGTLDLEALRSSGYQGPLDLEGFGVRADERRGLVASPATQPSVLSDPDDTHWSGGFDFPGTDGGVLALTVYDNKLVTGGWFTAAGGVAASRIAAWDGSSWSALGPGMNNAVRALTVYSNRLIAGGDFTTAGGVAANYIAAWDGSSWSALGSGMNSPVHALTVYDNRLIAGGDFATAGGDTVHYIAAWDGSSWSALGPGMTDYVEALTVYGNRLVAGGYFSKAGGVTAKCIATWDGSSWSALGSGVNGGVLALTVYDNKVVAAGGFTTAGGVAAKHTAIWDGSSWSALGSGMNSWVWALTVYDNKLIAGGDFVTAGGDTVNHIAAWDGSSWSTLGSGVDDYVFALTVHDNRLVAGGYFSAAGGVAARYIAVWSDSAWLAVGSGMNDDVGAVTVYGNRVIAGGDFTTAGGIVANRIAAWDGSGWSALGSGMDTTVSALAVYDSKLVAGGEFTAAGGAAANRIATWGGSSWSALGSGVNGQVIALTVYGGRLIAGGYFFTAGGVAVNRIAAWDGSGWSALGSGMDLVVLALTVYDNKLIAGGAFTIAGGAAANHIAAWDGSSWSALGSGMNSHVYDLAVYDNRLIAGGAFTTAGGVAAQYIAAWDGSSWSALDSGMNSDVYDLAVCDNRLVAGGRFTTAGGVAANRIGAWDGCAWAALGSGTSGSIYALATYDTTLMVGGTFIMAGAKPSSCIGQWTKRCTPVCSAAPTSLTIPDPVLLGTWRDTSFVISNTGCGRLYGSVSEVCDHFSILSGGGDYSLGPCETRTVVVRFEPTAIGEHACAIETGTSLCSDVSVTGIGTFDLAVGSHQKISGTDGNFTGALNNGDQFGHSVCLLGDLDGDGVGDLATGAFQDDDGGTDRGAVWVLFMNSDGTVKTYQKISDTEGNFTGVLYDANRFGWAVGSLGDLDGDGVEDLAVGACLDDDGGSNRGAVWVLFLNTDGTVKTHQKISSTEGGFNGVLDDGDRFGCAVCPLGDFDGDEVEDIAVGARYDGDGGGACGAVWLLLLNADGTVKTHQKISNTEGGFTGIIDSGDYFGYSVCSPGDLDGDGVGDLAVGAAGDDDGGSGRGAVWVLRLNADGTVKANQKISDTEGGFTGTLDDSDFFGISACSPGDLDGNGVGDLAAGAYQDDDGGTDRGCVWVLLLNADGTVRDHRKISSTAGSFTGTLDNADYFGYSVCSLGDIDGDGCYDLAAGACQDDDGGTDRGAVWVLYLQYDATAGIPDEHYVPASAEIHSFPNPSREITRIAFSLEREEAVTLAIYDVRGKLVRTLLNRQMGPGAYSQEWDGRADEGADVPSGIYFARLERGAEVSTAKIIVLR
jgi:hypothetical protein